MMYCILKHGCIYIYMYVCIILRMRPMAWVARWSGRWVINYRFDITHDQLAAAAISH